MGGNVWISQFVYIDELPPEAVTIGDNVTIGLRTSIFTHMYWGERRPEGGYKEVVIDKNAFIGPHCLIFPGVHIGEAAVVKGGSVLTRSVPAYTFWGPPEPGAIAKVTVPLTADYSCDEFVRGLRPIRRAKTKCPSINGIFRSRPAFSLLAILGVVSLRLRLPNRCGFGLNRNLPFLVGHKLRFIHPGSQDSVFTAVKGNYERRGRRERGRLGNVFR
jgi:hypothetical protein